MILYSKSGFKISGIQKYIICLYLYVRCAEILLKDITKQSLNVLEENTIPHETPLLLAAQHGHANASFFFGIIP